MRNASIPAGKLLWAALLVCCLQATLSSADETPINKPTDDNLQVDDYDMSKRDWNKNLKMWGKRGWNSLHGGWGVKRNNDQMPAWGEHLPYSVPIAEKRAWRGLSGGAWGKRSPNENDYTMQQLATLLEQEQNDDPHYTDYEMNDLMPNIDEKREWNPRFNGGWGKRNKWDKMRGVWGKRDPAWSNLKGIWGKRSTDQFAK